MAQSYQTVKLKVRIISPKIHNDRPKSELSNNGQWMSLGMLTLCPRLPDSMYDRPWTRYIPNVSHMTLPLSLCRRQGRVISVILARKTATYGRRTISLSSAPPLLILSSQCFWGGRLINFDATLYYCVQKCLTSTRRGNVWVQRALLTKSLLLTLNVSNVW